MTEIYKPGSLYQYNGQQFVELEPSDQRKLVVTDEAFDAVKLARKEAAMLIGMRPELSVVASAMILMAAEASKSELWERIRIYGLRLYS
jgi:hypothetical protein